MKHIRLHHEISALVPGRRKQMDVGGGGGVNSRNLGGPGHLGASTPR